MAKYTFEDIEILRQKSGISYEEAVNLLEYHNGSLARALVDLEKNGRLKTGPASGDAGKGAKGVFTFLYRLRLRVRKDEAVVVNLSSLFVLLTLITAPHICVIGLIVALAASISTATAASFPPKPLTAWSETPRKTCSTRYPASPSSFPRTAENPRSIPRRSPRTALRLPPAPKAPPAEPAP